MADQVYIKSILNNASAAGKKLLSVEFYSHMDLDLDQYKILNPTFCSLTWAHGDFSKSDSLPGVALAKRLRENSINMIMHVCGRNFKREEALTIMNKIKDMGVKNILALRGGSHILESDDSKCEFPYGLEFLQFLRKEYGDYFNVATGGYPIGHPTAEDPIKDIDYLKKKVDAGADLVLCQGVFDLEAFKTFYKKCREKNINVPIIPAVYAINSYQVLQNLMSFCKVVPESYLKTMEKLQNDNKAITDYSVEYVSDLIRSLVKDGDISIPGVHVCCFNNFGLVSQIFEKLDFSSLKIQRNFHCQQHNRN